MSFIIGQIIMKTIVNKKSKREQTVDEFLKQCEASCLAIRKTLSKIKNMEEPGSKRGSKSRSRSLKKKTKKR